MIRFFRYLLLVLAGLFGFAGHLSATTVYPLQLNAQIIPPYSNCLGDMVAGNVTSIRVTGLLRDLKAQSYNVGIGMQVYQGSQLKFATKTNHTEVVTNNTIHNFNLKDLFSPNNITGRYDGDGYCLKEGGYEFVFQAFDGGNARLPLSEPVRIHVYLSQAEPPRIIAPANGECVNYNAPVNFVWMEGAVTSYNPNRSYRLEIVELPEHTENLDAKSYINNNSTKITVEGIPGNLNFYTFQNTAGKLVKGRSYLWRVQLYDKTQMVSDARTVYSTSSAVANGGYSEVYSFKYTNCDPFGQRAEDLVDESKKPEIVRVDSSEAFSTVVWKNDPENFPCGYIVCFNRADDTLSNWARVEVGPTDSTYTFKNVENGVQYLTHIIGIVDCQDDGTKTLSANSDDGSFTLPVPAEQECSTTIDGLTSQYSVENLSPNDYFTANDRNIKINKIDRFIEGSDTTFSGEGQVLCPWFPSISLTTKFEKVKINRNHELVKGVVYVPTDSSNSGFFDLDEMMNDNYTGDGPAEQMTGKFKEYSKTDDIPEGSLGIVNGELYAMVNGEPVDLGKVVEASDYEGKIQKENIDAKSGIVDFEAISYWNPPIDNDREKYTGDIDRYYTNYSTSSGNYTVPWFAMPDGSTAEIKAKLQVNDNFPLDKLKFVCLTGSQAVELNAQKTQESGDFVYYKLPIFGGEGETSLNLYAVATDKNGNNITLGRAQTLSMPKFEQEVVLIPVQREASSIDQATIEKKLNEIYKPLGIAYKVKVADKFDSEELEFMKDGLEVSGSGFLSTETDAMKQLKKLYAQNHTIEKDVAYIFVCPKAKYDGAEVKGDMPRSGQTGYVFSTAETYNDGWTIAHELGHGLYSFEHTFLHDKQGTTNNLMDYANGTNLKVWQWNLLFSHKNFTIPFLESDEYGMFQAEAIADKFTIKQIPNTSNLVYYSDYDENKYYTFVNQAGKIILIPSKAHDLIFWGGSLISFIENDVKWSSYYNINTKKHIGIYKEKPKEKSVPYEELMSLMFFKGKTIKEFNYAYKKENDNCVYYWGKGTYDDKKETKSIINTLEQLPLDEKKVELVTVNNCLTKMDIKDNFKLYSIPPADYNYIGDKDKKEFLLPFLTPSLSKILIPKDAKNLTFKDGCLTSFSIAANVYVSYIYDKKHYGYFPEEPNEDLSNLYENQIPGVDNVDNVDYVFCLENEGCENKWICRKYPQNTTISNISDLQIKWSYTISDKFDYSLSNIPTEHKTLFELLLRRYESELDKVYKGCITYKQKLYEIFSKDSKLLIGAINNYEPFPVLHGEEFVHRYKLKDSHLGIHYLDDFCKDWDNFVDNNKCIAYWLALESPEIRFTPAYCTVQKIDVYNKFLEAVLPNGGSVNTFLSICNDDVIALFSYKNKEKCINSLLGTSGLDNLLRVLNSIEVNEENSNNLYKYLSNNNSEKIFLLKDKFDGVFGTANYTNFMKSVVKLLQPYYTSNYKNKSVDFWLNRTVYDIVYKYSQHIYVDHILEFSSSCKRNNSTFNIYNNVIYKTEYSYPDITDQRNKEENYELPQLENLSPLDPIVVSMNLNSEPDDIYDVLSAANNNSKEGIVPVIFLEYRSDIKGTENIKFCVEAGIDIASIAVGGYGIYSTATKIGWKGLKAAERFKSIPYFVSDAYTVFSGANDIGDKMIGFNETYTKWVSIISLLNTLPSAYKIRPVMNPSISDKISLGVSLLGDFDYFYNTYKSDEPQKMETLKSNLVNALGIDMNRANEIIQVLKTKKTNN